MKSQFVFPACALLLWTLWTVFVSCNADASGDDIQVKKISDGIKLSCPHEYFLKPGDKNPWPKDIILNYNDENTGEYTCVDNRTDTIKANKIFVKFRTCDNCIELTTASVVGMAIGDVVATTAIGVAVYLIASHAQTTPMASRNKSSDRQHLVSNEGSRSSNDHYQRLTPRRGQKDTYDVINSKR